MAPSSLRLLFAMMSGKCPVLLLLRHDGPDNYLKIAQTCTRPTRCILGGSGHWRFYGRDGSP